jgi:hypothetical protein
MKGPRAIEGLSLFAEHDAELDRGRPRMTAARWTGAALAALLLAAYLPLSPAYPSQPNRDAGGLLYFGSEILAGHIPYRDFWDHKPPLSYYLNALGLALAPGWWGVWGLEFLMMAGGLYASRRILRAFGTIAAAAGCALWICGVFVCSVYGRGGDLTENYALPLQFAAIWIWSRNALAARSDAVLFGLLSAAAFLLKPTLIGAWLVIGVLMLIDTRRLQWIGSAFLGFLIPTVPFVVYFAAHGALYEAMDQIFRYNRSYTAFATMADRLQTARFAFTVTLAFGALLGWLYWPFAAVQWRRAAAITRFAVLALPVELVLASLSGRGYQHYFIALLPSPAILTAAAIAQVNALAPPQHRRAAALGSVLVMLLLLMNPLKQIRLALAMRSNIFLPYAARRDQAASFVRRAVKPGQSVLIWGNEVSVNALAGRRSPTRYAYLHPLITTGYGDAARVNEFVNALRANPPAMIIDTSTTEPLVPPLDAASRRGWRPWPAYVPPPRFEEAIDWIDDHYVAIGFLRVSRWRIYVPKRATR